MKIFDEKLDWGIFFLQIFSPVFNEKNISVLLMSSQWVFISWFRISKSRKMNSINIKFQMSSIWRRKMNRVHKSFSLMTINSSGRNRKSIFWVNKKVHNRAFGRVKIKAKWFLPVGFDYKMWVSVTTTSGISSVISSVILTTRFTIFSVSFASWTSLSNVFDGCKWFKNFYKFCSGGCGRGWLRGCCGFGGCGWFRGSGWFLSGFGKGSFSGFRYGPSSSRFKSRSLPRPFCRRFKRRLGLYGFLINWLWLVSRFLLIYRWSV